MSKAVMQQALDSLKYNQSNWYGKREAIAALEAELAKPTNEFHPDWDTLQPYHDRIAELEAQLAKTEYSDLRAAAEMALEYLEYLDELDIAGLDHEIQSEALRQALAQPEQDHGFDRTASHMAGEYVDTANQEPVAWHYHNPDYPIQDGDWVEVIFTSGQPDDAKKWTPLYTAPQNPDVTITDEGKTEQEPVAWQVMVENEPMKEFSIKDVAHDWAVTEKLNGSKYLYWIRPLYAAPPKQWVGLTDEQIRLMAHNDAENDWNNLKFRAIWHSGYLAGFRSAEAKLREKNETT